MSFRTCISFLIVLMGVLSSAWAHLIESDRMILSLARGNLYFLHSFPVGRVAFADENGDGRLSLEEYERSRQQIETFLKEQMKISSGEEWRNWDDLRLQFSPDHEDETQATYITVAGAIAGISPVSSLALRYQLWMEADAGKTLEVVLRQKLENGEKKESLLRLKAPETELVFD